MRRSKNVKLFKEKFIDNKVLFLYLEISSNSNKYDLCFYDDRKVFLLLIVRMASYKNKTIFYVIFFNTCRNPTRSEACTDHIKLHILVQSCNSLQPIN